MNRGQVREFLLDTSKPVEERFEVLYRYLPYVRHSSYARAMWIALKEIYGYDDITPQNYLEITEKMREMNRPGIYEEVLVKKGRIKFALTQAGRTDYENPFMVPVLPMGYLTQFPRGRRDVEERGAKLGMTINTLDDYIEYCGERIRRWRDEERVVGLKTVSVPYREAPSDSEARGLFAKLMGHGRLEGGESAALEAYLRDKVLEICGREGFVVAVHSGVWDDFRNLDPRHSIPLFIRFPDTKFDLYHMGMPWVRDVVFIGGNWHNVYINWCWSHIVSYYMAQSGILEYLDYVPVNKIIAFGGDYSAPCLEKVIGHLRMAQENIATALARAVRDGRMSVDQAIEAARMWFWDNPVRIYDLNRLAS
ncbi:hypothetical protein DRP77_06030 [Candidatus Poribacteria bacterium]|nr:MAG: hypothetical protein DRP77_06030 [Candidatus Poribacteria bacterium]